MLAAAILGSSFVVTARADGGALVGLARAVSDEQTICYLQDVLVHPAWRRRGTAGDSSPPLNPGTSVSGNSCC